jgi:hypothetical protein
LSNFKDEVQGVKGFSERYFLITFFLEPWSSRIPCP